MTEYGVWLELLQARSWSITVIGLAPRLDMDGTVLPGARADTHIMPGIELVGGRKSHPLCSGGHPPPKVPNACLFSCDYAECIRFSYSVVSTADGTQAKG